jgi:hypothetical protein
MSGTFSTLHFPSTKMAAGKIATAAFLAPLIVTAPSSRFLPFITYLAKDDSLLA